MQAPAKHTGAGRDASTAPAVAENIDCVVIGRNEGARLADCLASLKGKFRTTVYVDSGSTDGSLQVADRFGATTVALDMNRPFTAARARNAGLSVLAASPPEFVQLIDGDCTLRETWTSAALDFLGSNPTVAVVCGRRRERFPEASVYNRLCDREWDTALGNTTACGGDAVMRFRSLLQVGGYRDALIAGEEPELCLRLRQAGWKIWRLNEEMTLHDANITRFSQWARRSRRAGHAFAEGAALHGVGPDRHWVTETRRAIGWGLVLPSVTAFLAVLSPFGLLGLLASPLQVARLALREGATRRDTWEFALFTTIGKFPEAFGVLACFVNSSRGQKTGIIEYG